METLRNNYIVILLAAVCFAREPECSRFHYEEKLLEKAIRSEIRMEAYGDSLKEATSSMDVQMQKISELTNAVQKQHEEIESLKTGEVKSSGVYTRWGRRSCPGTTELVYEGFAGGGEYGHKGASSNYICLPQDPIFDDDGRKAGDVSKVYGAEYQTDSATFLASLHDEDVPCAVCRVVGRSIIMIPARNACYSGWHTEYSGYLMSSFYGHEGNKEVVCMDGNPEKAEGSDSGNQNGALFFVAQAVCSSLKCPPYRENKALTCVVCSK
ncbi:short-chain collagen C4-like [Mya arenaria]|uniref:short-chain collagen C4-like n=1 Tax=Mya arenaria TaxID=6604 RepID=UPI0022E91995|nr:short-chain collagen C4-like [Mya arenaria]